MSDTLAGIVCVVLGASVDREDVIVGHTRVGAARRERKVAERCRVPLLAATCCLAHDSAAPRRARQAGHTRTGRHRTGLEGAGRALLPHSSVAILRAEAIGVLSDEFRVMKSLLAGWKEQINFSVGRNRLIRNDRFGLHTDVVHRARRAARG